MATTLHGEAVEVLRAAGKPLHVDDIWDGIRNRGVYKAATNTPQQSLATQLLRKTPGVDVTAATEEKLFRREGPNIFGLLEWKSDQSKSRSVEEKPNGPSFPEGHQERFVPPSTDVANVSATEGRELLRLHRTRERKPRLAARKKRQVLNQTGRLACEACGFDFAAEYGELGVGFAECHHTQPLAQAGERQTALGDLAVVCANCHRMLHRRPWRTVAQLRELLASRRADKQA